ncbi:MAG: TIGR04211 family SH3 domain-containing protein [Desulfamplus sp.]|nr:TIGR04211 family SH3 domain-containing protein [Desulfamplus sp.]
MKKIKKIQRYSVIYMVLIFSCFLIAIPSLYAETGYVSDMLILSLKEKPGRQYNTIKTLRSNTPVEIVETTDRFLKVKTEEGDMGWVESQYITRELPKTIIIEQLTAKLESLQGKTPNSESEQNPNSENKNNELANTMQNKKEIEYINKIKALEASLNAQIEKNKQLEAQLSQSYAKTTELNQTKPELNQKQREQNQTKSEENQETASQNNIQNMMQDQDIVEEDIQEEEHLIEKNGTLISSEEDNIVLPNDDLLKTSMIKWFCAGAGVLIAGWFIGRSFSGGRRRGGGSLLD